MKDELKYGAPVERGILAEKKGDGSYIVNSLSRPGIRSGALRTVTGAEAEIGETVYFALFPDGSGIILR